MHFYFSISQVHCGFAWHFMEVHWLFPVSWRSYLTCLCFKCIYWFMIGGSNEERLWCVEMRLTIYHYIEIQAWLHLLFITVYFTMALNSINGIFFPLAFHKETEAENQVALLYVGRFSLLFSGAITLHYPILLITLIHMCACADTHTHTP